MNKLLGGGLAVAFTAAGTLLLAGPGSAQSVEDLGASLSTLTPAPGATVTATATDPCTETDEYGLDWEISLPSPTAPTLASGNVAYADGGGWTATFTAPTEPGDYSFWAFCADDGFSDYQVNFKVVAPTPPSSEAPPSTEAPTTTVQPTTPPPAPAVAGTPKYTG